MKRTTAIVTIGLALAATLLTSAAQAQLQHTFVSSKGSDLNNCSLAAPCRHLQNALAATLAGGEIAILDTAGYNGGTTVTIDKAISIVAPLGIEAEIAPPSGGYGIVINAGANDAVSLRGLTIDGGGVGVHGVVFNSGKSLTIQNCVARNLTSSGIAVNPSTSSNIVMSNTVVANNGGHGVYVQPTGSVWVSTVFNHVEAYSNGGVGIGLYGNMINQGTGHFEAKAINSVAAYNSTAGFYALGPIIFFTVYRSSAFANTNFNYASGIRAEGGAGIDVSQSDVMSDGWSVDNSSSHIFSFGDNVSDQSAPSGVLPLR